MPLAVNDILEVKVHCATQVQLSLNVRHYRVSATAGASLSEASVAAGLSTALAPLYKALTSVHADYRGLSCQKIYPLPVNVPAVNIGGQAAGLILGDLLPRQTSGLITLRTLLGGRANRGRVYVGFPGEASNDVNSFPVNQYVTDLQLLAGELVTTKVFAVGADSVTVEPCIWHRTTQTTTPLQAGFARSDWATQRRRGSFGQSNFIPF